MISPSFDLMTSIAIGYYGEYSRSHSYSENRFTSRDRSRRSSRYRSRNSRGYHHGDRSRSRFRKEQQGSRSASRNRSRSSSRHRSRNSRGYYHGDRSRSRFRNDRQPYARSVSRDMSERSISSRNETNSVQEPIGEMPSDIIVLDNTEKPRNSEEFTTAESNEKQARIQRRSVLKAYRGPNFKRFSVLRFMKSEFLLQRSYQTWLPCGNLFWPRAFPEKRQKRFQRSTHPP